MPVFEDNLPFHPFGGRDLRLQIPNIVGTDVKVFQTLFNQLLIITHPPLGPIGTPVTRDGVYGPKTTTAARQIQSYFGLSVDGVVGPQTLLAMGQAVRSDVSYGGPAFGSRTLSQGSSGGDVTVLQNRLNLFRYSTALGGAAAGQFGPATAAAATQFKADAISNGDDGLNVNGVVGVGSLDALWVYTGAGGRNLGQGAAGLDAAFLQYLLATLSNPGTGQPFYSGAVDGYCGPETASAIRAFQASVGIVADGIAGPSTYYRLGLHNQVAAPRPAPVPPVA